MPIASKTFVVEQKSRKPMIVFTLECFAVYSIRKVQSYIHLLVYQKPKVLPTDYKNPKFITNQEDLFKALLMWIDYFIINKSIKLYCIHALDIVWLLGFESVPACAKKVWPQD